MDRKTTVLTHLIGGIPAGPASVRMPAYGRARPDPSSIRVQWSFATLSGNNSMRFNAHPLTFAACVLCLSAATSDAVGFDLSNGRRIILQRGLQIQSLGFVSSTPAPLTDYSLWNSANFTTFNSWNDKNSEKTLGWTMP